MSTSLAKCRMYATLFLAVQNRSICRFQHEVLAAVAADRSVILCKELLNCLSRLLLITRHSQLGGHSNTERGYLPILANRLREEFSKLDGEGWALAKEISFHVSDNDADPLITV